MRTNPVKAALAAGGTVFGSEVTRLRSGEVPRIFAAAGFDFAFIDTEHTAFNLETVADMIQAARAAGIVPIVRVPQAEYAWVARVLDCGAQGVIAPRINTAAQVEALVSWVRYPPAGVRGYASTFMQTDGEPVEPADFVRHNDQQTLLVIQIERRQSVANLEQMLSIPGVDVACLGSMDLSVDLGVPGQTDHPEMVAAIEKVIEVSRRHGLAAGIISPCLATVRHWVGRGVRFVSYASEAQFLAAAATAAARQLRSRCQDPAASDAQHRTGP